MDSISAVIIDDEQSACNILTRLIERFAEHINIVGVANNLEDGSVMIKEKQPDLVFLDIQMPRYSGLEILEFFPSPTFDIVFVTAYDHYALRAFDLSAVDYVLKPIDIDKFKITIERIKERFNRKLLSQNYETLKENLKQSHPSHVVLSSLEDSVTIELSHVVAFEADESYTHLHLLDNKQMASKNLKHFENLLIDHPDFYRSHKSWIINLNHISHFTKVKSEIMMSNGLVTKLSRLKKSELHDLLK